jgi:hypothetical protein
MRLADLTFRQRDQAYAGKAQLLVQCGCVFLIARQPVERFRDDDVEGTGAGVLQQLLVARPASGACWSGRSVMVLTDDGRSTWSVTTAPQR